MYIHFVYLSFIIESHYLSPEYRTLSENYYFLFMAPLCIQLKAWCKLMIIKHNHYTIKWLDWVVCACVCAHVFLKIYFCFFKFSIFKDKWFQLFFKLQWFHPCDIKSFLLGYLCCSPLIYFYKFHLVGALNLELWAASWDWWLGVTQGTLWRLLEQVKPWKTSLLHTRGQ